MEGQDIARVHIRMGALRFILWILVFVLLVIYHTMYSFDHLTATSFVSAGIDCLGLRCCSIVINRWMISKLLYRKRTGVFILCFAALFLISSFCIQVLELGWYRLAASLNEQGRIVFTTFSFQVFNTYLIQLLGCLGITAFRLLNDYWSSQTRYEILQKENARTELSFLKAQINPHFLFNSLNSLYAEIEKTNPGARNILLKLSDMLRYQLYDCSADKISIEKELTYLRNYITLEGLRKNNYLSIRTDLQDLSGFNIAPLLFVPIIENAFKYASNHEEQENSLETRLYCKDGDLVFYCRNTRDQILSRELAGDNGIGIKNLKRRLTLLYPGKHALRINDQPEFYEVELKLKIT